MALRGRVWNAGKLLLIVGALLTTYVISAALAARVALRAREVTVPSLVGRPLNSASALLGASGLTLRVDEVKRADPNIPAGRIALQDPSPGSTARRGRTVRVWVSTGGVASTVPALVGQSERAARMQLQQDGLALVTVSDFRSNQFPADVVVAQDPPAGSRAAGVSLLVNRAGLGATYVMPDLIGVDGARAADALRSGGFRVAVVGQQPYPGVPPGTVIRQSPQAGFQVSPGDTVSLEVSR